MSRRRYKPPRYYSEKGSDVAGHKGRYQRALGEAYRNRKRHGKPGIIKA